MDKIFFEGLSLSMDILYIKRQHYSINNFFEWIFKKRDQRLKNFVKFQGANNLFRGSLYNIADVTEKNFQFLSKNYDSSYVSNFDFIILSNGSIYPRIGNDHFSQLKFLKNLTLPKILFIDHDYSTYMQSDMILNLFDLVFKRELFKDLDRYNISEHNKQKLRPTILACGSLIPANYFNVTSIDPSNYGENSPPSDFDHDVFFAGISYGTHRENVWRMVKNSQFESYGGLYPWCDEEVDETLKFEKLPFEDYKSKIRSTKINLALSSASPISRRHPEIWGLSSFMLCSSSIKELDFPFECREGKHFESFSDKRELLNKIEFYLNHPKQRDEIAENGRKLFEEAFSFQNHGDFVRKQLKSLRV